MGLFGFGSKKTATATEEGEMGPGMVNMLAGMPAEQRKQMMKGRLSQLLTLDEERRQQAILGMFGSFHSGQVKERDREKVIATRTEIIGEFTEDQRRSMMTSRMVALQQRPELEEADQKVMQKVMPTVPQEARTVFLGTMNALHGES